MGTNDDDPRVNNVGLEDRRGYRGAAPQPGRRVRLPEMMSLASNCAGASKKNSSDALQVGRRVVKSPGKVRVAGR